MANVPRPKIYFKLLTILILIGGCVAMFGMYQLQEITPSLERLNKINSAGALLGTEKAASLINQAETSVLNYTKKLQGPAPFELRSLFSQIDDQLLFLNAEILENLTSLTVRPDSHSLQRVTALLNRIQYLQQTLNRVENVLLAIEDIAPLPQQQVKLKELSDKIPPLFRTTEIPLLEIAQTYKIMINKEKQGLEARKIIALNCRNYGTVVAFIVFIGLIFRVGYVRGVTKRGNNSSVAKSKGSAQT